MYLLHSLTHSEKEKSGFRVSVHARVLVHGGRDVRDGMPASLSTHAHKHGWQGWIWNGKHTCDKQMFFPKCVLFAADRRQDVCAGWMRLRSDEKAEG